ncbi:unnamed protein product [Spirodela intermedia]|uniref:MYND-type domain-containing protein n=1 Tax=Spirodela intermedia TaxID=51605 RepID=A0A7I8IVF7_SPIIN|nr:unnamed protein product [Spirodela intermedia]CAA6661976.1 unnamed protein product [Spirodela intermedia]
MCSSMKCLLQDQHEQWKRRVDNPSRSVKVFRCQLPRSNPFYSSEPPLYDGSDKPSGAGGNYVFIFVLYMIFLLMLSAPLCCWCGTWKGDKLCSSCRRARYCSERHQTLHWRSGHKSDCRQSISSQTSDSMLNFACRTLWPEYEIINEDECVQDEKMTVNDDKKSWASFQERIANAPEQVLRYSRDVRAKPLWPLSAGRPSKADIPKCNYCGGPLCYEFQILPQLLYYFGVKNDPDSLDWATISVFTCMASCEAGIGYKEEFAWVQLSTPSASI